MNGTIKNAKGESRLKTRRNADISKELAALQQQLDTSPTVDWEWLEEKIKKLA